MSPRTRSCATCRKKRIKCDATYPTCLMCSRFGRRCPGVEDGLMMVDMTPKARYGMQRRRQTDTNVVAKYDTKPKRIVAYISTHAFVREAFFARFLTYWTSEGEGKDIRNKASWLQRLPSLSTDGENEALELALQATAASYCAVDLEDLALTQYAWNLYGQAVSRHGSYLAKTRSGRKDITIHTISTSVLFSFFEAMQSTNADAYHSHIYGAARMFEVTDPRQCHEGVLCQIFYHLRTQIAFAQLTSSSRKTPVNVHKILRDALSYEELPIFQRLTTHVTTLASMYNNLDATYTSKVAVQVDLVDYMIVKGNIDELWLEFNNKLDVEEKLSWHAGKTEGAMYQDAFTALTIGYFSAARILLSALAPRLAASYLDLTDHYRHILDAASYVQVSRQGFAYMRMALPLLLVAIHSPVMEQRRAARAYFEHWSTGSMRGISSLALETIEHRLQEAAE